MATWWAEHAWLGGPAAAPGVLLQEKEGRWVTVTPSVTDPPPDATRLPGLTLPGLANAHSHCFHRALRARTHTGPGTFWTWRQQMYHLAERLDPDGYRRLATAVFAEMVLSGFTTVGEFHYLHHRPGGRPYADANEMGQAVIDGAAAAGIRLTLLDTCFLRGDFDAPLEGAQLRFGDTDAESWVARVDCLKADAMLRIGAAVHSVRAVPPPAIRTVASWAASRGNPLHAHVAEQPAEQQQSLSHLGTTPLAALRDAGAVTESFTAVHGTHCTEEDITALGRAGAACCICPTTERDLGDGTGPAANLHRAGVRLCLGTDSHAVIDGFEEARAIELDERLAAQRRGLLEPATLLEAATTGGMKALGWDAGRIEAGQLADLVAIALDTPRTAGCDPSSVATAVYAATAADVRHVVVGGRTVVSDGLHRTIEDVPARLAAEVAAMWT